LPTCSSTASLTVFLVNTMDMYQHDSAATFRFVLMGELTGGAVHELQYAWDTAKSSLAGKELVVELSGLTSADPLGIELLSRMRESGARLAAALPPKCEELSRSFSLSAAEPCRDRRSTWALRILKLAGLAG
jgi:ABC-type transporter Mla MlaB component